MTDPELRDLDHTEQVRARQRGKALVLALILGGFVVLTFAITIAKIKAGMAH